MRHTGWNDWDRERVRLRYTWWLWLPVLQVYAFHRVRGWQWRDATPAEALGVALAYEESRRPRPEPVLPSAAQLRQLANWVEASQGDRVVYTGAPGAVVVPGGRAAASGGPVGPPADPDNVLGAAPRSWQLQAAAAAPPANHDTVKAGPRPDPLGPGRPRPVPSLGRRR